MRRPHRVIGIPLKQLQIWVIQILPAVRTFRRWSLERHRKVNNVTAVETTAVKLFVKKQKQKTNIDTFAVSPVLVVLDFDSSVAGLQTPNTELASHSL